MTRALTFIALALVLAPSPASAQLTLAKDNPIVYGHHHIAASDINAHKKFFIDALGGTAGTFGPNKVEIVKFPNVLIFFRQQPPTGEQSQPQPTGQQGQSSSGQADLGQSGDTATLSGEQRGFGQGAGQSGGASQGGSGGFVGSQGGGSSDYLQEKAATAESTAELTDESTDESTDAAQGALEDEDIETGQAQSRDSDIDGSSGKI